MNELPEEIAEVLQRVAEGYTPINAAQELLDRYRPKPKTPQAKTLENYGPIRWRRTYRPSVGTELVEGLDDIGGNGIPLDEAGNFFRSGTLTPWPKIEGHNPSSILHHGWQIIEFSAVSYTHLTLPTKA